MAKTTKKSAVGAMTTATDPALTPPSNQPKKKTAKGKLAR